MLLHLLFSSSTAALSALNKWELPRTNVTNVTWRLEWRVSPWGWTKRTAGACSRWTPARPWGWSWSKRGQICRRWTGRSTEPRLREPVPWIPLGSSGLSRSKGGRKVTTSGLISKHQMFLCSSHLDYLIVYANTCTVYKRTSKLNPSPITHTFFSQPGGAEPQGGITWRDSAIFFVVCDKSVCPISSVKLIEPHRDRQL